MWGKFQSAAAQEHSGVATYSQAGASSHTISPYAGMEKRHLTALSVQQIADLQTGRGMGLSLVAELNGCPGPLHVLELGEVSSSLRCSGRGQKGLLDAVKAPEGFRTLHVHDLRHTVGRRLREAGVAHETRQAILGHKSGSITTHHSAAELRELIDAMEFIATDNACESHALTLLKRKAG